MKFKSVAVLIILVALLSIATSGCSSLGIALDTNSVEEKYSVTLHRDLSDTEENKTTNNIQVLPKIVRGKSYSTLITFNQFLPFGGIPLLDFGFDYEVIYLGYDSTKVASNVINNKKSLSKSLEEPNTESNNNFNYFSIYPQFKAIINFGDTTNNFFVSYTVNMSELYTTVQYNKKKYSIDKFSSIGFDIGLNFFENSIFYREQNVSSVAESKDRTDEISIKYAHRLLGYRYYF